jgi:hypothetical protein
VYRSIFYEESNGGTSIGLQSLIAEQYHNTVGKIDLRSRIFKIGYYDICIRDEYRLIMFIGQFFTTNLMVLSA